jgi:hypothetical protein
VKIWMAKPVVIAIVPVAVARIELCEFHLLALNDLTLNPILCSRLFSQSES